MKWLAPLIILAVLLIFGAWFCSKGPEAKVEVQEYEIKVYDFNKDTGHGYAYLKQGDKTPAVRIDVEKYNAANTAKTFTGSAHEDAFIKVKGKLTGAEGHPEALTIVENQ